MGKLVVIIHCPFSHVLLHYGIISPGLPLERAFFLPPFFLEWLYGGEKRLQNISGKLNGPPTCSKMFLTPNLYIAWHPLLLYTKITTKRNNIIFYVFDICIITFTMCRLHNHVKFTHYERKDTQCMKCKKKFSIPFLIIHFMLH